MVSKSSLRAIPWVSRDSKSHGSHRRNLRFVAANRPTVGGRWEEARAVARERSWEKRRKWSCGQIPRMGHRR